MPGTWELLAITSLELAGHTRLQNVIVCLCLVDQFQFLPRLWLTQANHLPRVITIKLWLNLVLVRLLRA